MEFMSTTGVYVSRKSGGYIYKEMTEIAWYFIFSLVMLIMGVNGEACLKSEFKKAS